MKTIYMLVIGVFVLSGVLVAQPGSFQIGLNVVPLVDRTRAWPGIRILDARRVFISEVLPKSMVENRFRALHRFSTH